MDYGALMMRVLVYVDSNLSEDLSSERLAAVAGFSHYHFCRVFLWHVGYPVMEYVRRRRLAFAASALHKSQKIIDVAMAYGFETHSGFSKAFRRYYGCTPEAYRIRGIFSTPLFPSLRQIDQNMDGGIMMNPKILSLPAIRLVGYALDTTSENGENLAAIPAFWDAYLTDGRMQKLHKESFVKSHSEYGACFPRNPEMGEITYMIGVEMKEGVAMPENFCVKEIPASAYAVFSTPPSDETNFSKNIQQIWQSVHSEWFPTSGCEYAPGCVDFELYDDRCMTRDAKVCDIYIPIVKKEP